MQESELVPPGKHQVSTLLRHTTFEVVPSNPLYLLELSFRHLRLLSRMDYCSVTALNLCVLARGKLIDSINGPCWNSRSKSPKTLTLIIGQFSRSLEDIKRGTGCLFVSQPPQLSFEFLPHQRISLNFCEFIPGPTLVTSV